MKTAQSKALPLVTQIRIFINQQYYESMLHSLPKSINYYNVCQATLYKFFKNHFPIITSTSANVASLQLLMAATCGDNL